MKVRVSDVFKVALFFLFSYSFSQLYFLVNLNYIENLEQIIGDSSKLSSTWIGTKDVDKNIPILILAGHADSQGLVGSGTPGEAVDNFGLDPMNPKIMNELF